MRASFVCCVVSCFAPVASAEDIWVPADFPTIQEAIDAAQPGDVVCVSPGIYPENINFMGKPITVRSDADGVPGTHDPSPDNTIIDGGSNGTTVTFFFFELNSSVLEGLSLIHI